MYLPGFCENCHYDNPKSSWLRDVWSINNKYPKQNGLKSSDANRASRWRDSTMGTVPSEVSLRGVRSRDNQHPILTGWAWGAQRSRAVNSSKTDGNRRFVLTTGLPTIACVASADITQLSWMPPFRCLFWDISPFCFLPDAFSQLTPSRCFYTTNKEAQFDFSRCGHFIFAHNFLSHNSIAQASTLARVNHGSHTRRSIRG